MHEQIWNLTLAQVLQLPSNNKIFAIALSKSRNQVMSQQLGYLLANAVRQHGGKWLEVVARVLRNDYHIGFQYAIENELLLQPIISLFFEQPQNHQTEAYHKKILQKLLTRISLFSSSASLMSPMPIAPLVCLRSLSLYMQECLSPSCPVSYLDQFFKVIAQNSSSFRNMLTFGNCVNENNKEIYHVQIQILASIVQAIVKLETLAVRNMKFGQFLDFVGRRQSGNTVSVKEIVQENLLNVSQLIINMDHTDPKQTQHNTNLYKILLHTLQSSILQQSVLSTPQLLQGLLYQLKTKPLLQLNNPSDISIQLQALTEQISTHTYSDTLAGLHLALLQKLLEMSQGFFTGFVEQLVNGVSHYGQETGYGGQGVSRDLGNFVDILFKVLILSHPSILSRRESEVQQTVQTIMNIIQQHYEQYTDAQKLQVVRLFVVFLGNTNTTPTGSSSGSQQILSKCLSQCFSLLHSSSPLLKSQCHQILHLIPHNPNLRPLLLHLLPQILWHFLGHQNGGVQLQTIELFQQYLLELPELIQRSSLLLLQYLSKIYQTELQSTHHSSNHSQLKDTLVIARVLDVVDVVLGKATDIGFEDVEDIVVKGMLGGLLGKREALYQEQLLSILNVVLDKHSHLSPSTLQILSKLPILYNENNKKLSLITPFLVTFVSNNYLKKQIIYQYSDLIAMILGMIEDYTAAAICCEEWLYYQEEVRLLIWAIIGFLIQIVSECPETHCQTLTKILQNTTTQQTQCQKALWLRKQSLINPDVPHPQLKPYLQYHQLLIQLSICVSHILVHPSAFTLVHSKALLQTLQQTALENYAYYETIKMIPVFLVERVLGLQDDNYEGAVKDLVNFCQYAGKMGTQWGINKQWGKVKGVQMWVNWPWAVRVYVESVLKELVTRRAIDKVDYLGYIQQINEVLRT